MASRMIKIQLPSMEPLKTITRQEMVEMNYQIQEQKHKLRYMEMEEKVKPFRQQRDAEKLQRDEHMNKLIAEQRQFNNQERQIQYELIQSRHLQQDPCVQKFNTAYREKQCFLLNEKLEAINTMKRQSELQQHRKYDESVARDISEALKYDEALARERIEKGRITCEENRKILEERKHEIEIERQLMLEEEKRQRDQDLKKTPDSEEQKAKKRRTREFLRQNKPHQRISKVMSYKARLEERGESLDSSFVCDMNAKQQKIDEAQALNNKCREIKTQIVSEKRAEANKIQAAKEALVEEKIFREETVQRVMAAKRLEQDQQKKEANGKLHNTGLLEQMRQQKLLKDAECGKKYQERLNAVESDRLYDLEQEKKRRVEKETRASYCLENMALHKERCVFREKQDRTEKDKLIQIVEKKREEMERERKDYITARLGKAVENGLNAEHFLNLNVKPSMHLSSNPKGKPLGQFDTHEARVMKTLQEARNMYVPLPNKNPVMVPAVKRPAGHQLTVGDIVAGANDRTTIPKPTKELNPYSPLPNIDSRHTHTLNGRTTTRTW